jgi:hypothetical protein
VDTITEKVERLTDALIGLTGISGRLFEAQAQTERSLRETDARLTAHIASVESHLDVVIEMFEKHLQKDHGSTPS